MVDNILLYGRIEALEQRHAPRETLLEINLPAHSRERDRFDLVTHAGTHRQFVNDFRLDEGRVHIDADQTPISTEHIVLLE